MQVSNMKKRGQHFLEVPVTYYTNLKERLKKSKINITEDMDKVIVVGVCLSSPEPKAHGWANSIPVTLSTFSNNFSSETTGPIKLKFHMETPSDTGTKVCSNGLG